MDVNEDEQIDIVIGIIGESNQVLYGNGDGTFSNATALPGGNTCN